MKHFFTLFITLIPFTLAFAQDFEEEEFESVRNEHAAYFAEPEHRAGLDSISMNVTDMLASGFAPKKARPASCRLSKQVYGYHPYWFGPAYYMNYDYTLLTHFSYFSYELNPYNGHYKTIHDWRTSAAITMAQMAGCKVELSVTNFGGKRNALFLTNKKSWKRLADNLIELLTCRDADGVNLDFEHVRKANGPHLTAFVKYLYERFEAERPGMTITMAVPGLNNYRIYNILELSPYVDSFVIMGYDYHYKSSPYAGPVAPLGGYVSIRSSLQSYTSSGVDPKKLILAVPYYGREWSTKNHAVPSAVTSYQKTPTYADIQEDYMGTYTERWHEKSASPYFVRIVDGGIRQCWFDSRASIGEKYDLAIDHCIGGVGMWALGYDNGYSDLWGLIEDKFVDCTQPKAPVEAADSKERKPYVMRWLEGYMKSFVE